MNPWMDYLLKMFLVSGILYGYYHLALRDNRFHQWNRFYLLGAVVLSVILPAIHISVHRASEGDNQLLFAVWDAINSHQTTVSRSIATVHNPTGWVALASIPALIYAALVLIQFFALVWRIGALRRLFLKSPHVQLERITLVETAAKGTPYSFFRWIFWNRAVNLDSSEGQHILKHELTHVNQRHSLDKMLLQVFCIVFFPVVFLHLIRKELQLIHEYLADKEATADGALADYARLLVSQAFEASPLAFANSFYQNPIKRRINMMTRLSNPRFTYIRKLMFLPLAAILFGLLAFKVDAAHPILSVRLLQAEEHLQNVFTVTEVPPTVASATDARLRCVARLPKDTVPTQQQSVVQQVTVIGYQRDTLVKTGSVRVVGLHQDTLNATEQVTVLGYRRDTLPRDAAVEGVTNLDTILVIVDGKRYVGGTSVLKTLNPNQIESISVWKNEEAIEKFGSEAAHGVVDIHLKKDTLGLRPTTDLAEGVFTKVEQEAAFPGGDQAWHMYVDRLLAVHMDELKADNQSGTCVVEFIVNKDGSVRDVHAVTMEGTKLASISENAILKGPKWVPARQNGLIVTAYRRQKITYNVPN